MARSSYPLALALLLAPACGRGTPQTVAAPELSSAAPSAVATPAPSEPEPTPPAPRSLRVEELVEKAVAVIPEQQRWGLTLTPVLPCVWPVAEPCVQFLGYDKQPLPTGTIQYRYRGPLAIVRCALPAANCVFEPLQTAVDEFVEIENIGANVPDASAQQVLLEIAQTAQPPESVPASLAPYATWLEQHGGLGASVRSRVQEFAAWLVKGGVGVSSE